MQQASKVAIKSKQPHLQTSIFAIMSALAAREDAINLSQGFPDFQCHPGLIESFHKHLKAGHNQYAPMPGVPALRERIAEKTEFLYGTVYNPENEITITSGATAALSTAITTIVNPGDEVIVLEPWYDSYIPMVGYNGGRAVSVPMTLPDFEIDWRLVKKAITEKTKAIILNSPNNPAGVLLNEEDIRQLINLVKGTSLIVISDEVYEHIIFDGRKHLSLASLPELASRSFVISSFGKTFHATGWKVGYCLAPADMMYEFRKMHQFVTFSVNTPAQYAYADFMAEKDNYLSVTPFYQEKRDLFNDALRASRFDIRKCSGTYFQLADYSKISDENDLDFAKRITREFKVASIPTSVFFNRKTQQKIIRFCFAKKDVTLKKAGDILCRI
jgi:methionine transaminase